MPQTERDARIYGISLSETQNSCPLPPLMEWTINLNVQTDNMPYVKRLLMEEHEAAKLEAEAPKLPLSACDDIHEMAANRFPLMPSARETICKRPVKISSLDS